MDTDLGACVIPMIGVFGLLLLYLAIYKDKHNSQVPPEWKGGSELENQIFDDMEESWKE